MRDLAESLRAMPERPEVAEVIWKAAHDESARLRYVSGEGAERVLSGWYALEQDEAFVAAMRKRFGMDA